LASNELKGLGRNPQ